MVPYPWIATLNCNGVLMSSIFYFKPSTVSPPCGPPKEQMSDLENVWASSKTKKQLQFSDIVRHVAKLRNLTLRSKINASIAAAKEKSASKKTLPNVEEHGTREGVRRRATFTTYRPPQCNYIIYPVPSISTSKATSTKSPNVSQHFDKFPNLPLRENSIENGEPCSGNEKGAGRGEEKGASRSEENRYIVKNPKRFIEEAILRRRGCCPTNPHLGNQLRRDKLVNTLNLSTDSTA